MRYQDSIYLQYMGKAGTAAALATRRFRAIKAALAAQTLQASVLSTPESEKPAEEEHKS